MDRGSGEHRQSVSEKDILDRVAGKFKTYLEAKKNSIMAAVQFAAVDNFIILCNLHHKLILFVIVKGKGGCYIFMFS